MKKITIIFLLFSFLNGVSQTLSKKEIAKLNSLEIKTENLNLENTNIQNDLNKILKLERKRRTNKTVGIVMTTISVSGMVLGGGVLLSKKKWFNRCFWRNYGCEWSSLWWNFNTFLGCIKEKEKGKG
ncbi:hypothetical protein [uncultured Polaribacter sp.]|uniref:hypothetical protein n=1 Tax=uncultured Polaribacter sp. TaxID=174711 RepID=UPI00261E89B2|nr:hypothetical protein [uncultured Polaribacter sp.]